MKKYIIALAVFALSIPTVLFAANLQAGEEVFYASGQEIQDNLYAAGGSVSVNSLVVGDVFAVGGSVLISGDVKEDIVIAGGSVTILGNTDGDVRVVGGNILVSGTITGELIVVGGSVVLAPTAVIAKDVVVAGGQISLDGNIGGNVQLAGGVVSINGHIVGDVMGQIEEKLTIGNSAVIEGGLDYTATHSEVLNFQEGAVIRGETMFNESVFTKFQAKEKAQLIEWTFLFVKFLAILMAALVIALSFRKFSTTVVEQVVQQPIRALIIGFATCVLLPISAIVLCVSLLGAPLGMLLFLLCGFLMLVSFIYSGVVVGGWICKIVRKSKQVVVRWEGIAFGTLLFSAVVLLPILGWFVGLFVFWTTLGGVTENIWKALQKQR